MSRTSSTRFAGTGTYSFDIASWRIPAIYVVRDPRQAVWFLQHTD